MITHCDDSERGRIVMAEVSWLSDYKQDHKQLQGVETTAAQGFSGLDWSAGLDEEEQGWQERALCAETDPEAFFPEKGGSTREAKKICTGCDVRVECLEYALGNDERFGIWGGLSERERRRLRRQAV